METNERGCDTESPVQNVRTAWTDANCSSNSTEILQLMSSDWFSILQKKSRGFKWDIYLQPEWFCWNFRCLINECSLITTLLNTERSKSAATTRLELENKWKDVCKIKLWPTFLHELKDRSNTFHKLSHAVVMASTMHLERN
jgi:hypothetical protein